MATKRELAKLMTIKQIADETGQDEATIRTIVGRMVAVRTGGRKLLFKRADVERVFPVEEWRQ